MKMRLMVTALAVVTAVGCTEGGESIVPVDVTANAAAAALNLASVDVVVTHKGKEVGKKSWMWKPAGLMVGLRLPAGVSGAAHVSAIGINAAGMEVAYALEKPVTVAPGKTTMTVSLVLTDQAPPVTPDGGSGGSGGGSGGSDDGGAGTGGSDAPADTAMDGGADLPRTDVPTDVPPPVQRSWRTAALAEMNIDEADTQPDLAMDAAGNAVLVYQHGGQLWFNRYNATTNAWGTAGPIGTIAGDGPQVAIDGNGIATVIWAAAASTVEARGIWSSTANLAGAGTTWSAPVRVSAGRAAGPVLAAGGNGAVIAAWTENNLVNSNNEYIVWVSNRPPGGAWTAARAIQNARDTGDREPRVAMDAAGNGFLIWHQTQPTVMPTDENDSIWLSRYTGGTFGTPMLMETANDDDAYAPDVAVNAGGVGVATWLQDNMALSELWARNFVSGSWGAPMLIASSSSIDWIFTPETAVDPAGNAVAVWSQTLATGTFNARIARFRVGQPRWDDPIPLETDNMITGVSADAFLRPWPDVGIDGAGNAHVVWRKKIASGQLTLWTRRLDSAGALGAPLRLDTEMTSVFNQQIDVALNGTAIASWYHGTALDIWAAVFR